MAYNHQIYEDRAGSHRLEDVWKKKNTHKKFTKAEAEHNFKKSYEIQIKENLSEYVPPKRKNL